jgi:2'-5' RNA ligase
MRLFIAIDLPERIKETLRGIIREFRDVRGLRFVDPDNSHLTLLFIGETNKAEQIRQKLKTIEFEAFSLETSGLGCFERSKKVSVFWLGLAASPELSALQGQVKSLFPDVKPDFKGFSAHITIARANYDVDSEKLKERIRKCKVDEIKFSVASFALYSSDLSGGKPKYTVLEEIRGKE